MIVLAWLAVLLVSGFVALKSSEETGKVVFVVLALPLTVWGAVAHRSRGGSSDGGGSCGGGCGGCGGGD